MFTFEELCQLIHVVAETRVGGVEVERDGVRFRIDGVPAAPAAPSTPLFPPQLGGATVHLPAALPHTHATGAAVVAADDGLITITSPIVGTFYRAPNPDTDPYVKIGDNVEKGQVLCIVEAMKLMNEIESDASGVIVSIFPDNAKPVEFGERLFAIRSN